MFLCIPVQRSKTTKEKTPTSEETWDDEPPPLLPEKDEEEKFFFGALDPSQEHVKTTVKSFVKSLLQTEEDILAATVDRVGMASLLEARAHEQSPFTNPILLAIHAMRQSGLQGYQNVKVDGVIVKRSVNIDNFFQDDNYPFHFYNNQRGVPKAVLLPTYEGDACFCRVWLYEVTMGCNFSTTSLKQSMSHVASLGNYSRPELAKRIFNSDSKSPVPKNPMLRTVMLGSAAALQELIEEGLLPKSKLSLWKPKPDSDTQYDSAHQGPPTKRPIQPKSQQSSGVPTNPNIEPFPVDGFMVFSPTPTEEAAMADLVIDETVLEDKEVEDAAPMPILFYQGDSSLVRGIRNSRNTCYQSSVLQLLFETHDFWTNLGNSGSDLGQLLFSLCQDLTIPSMYPVDPRPFTDIVIDTHNDFEHGQQADAAECLIHVLNSIEGELEADRDAERRKQCQHLVGDNFGWQFTSWFCCKSCGRETEPEHEVQLVLQLPIEPSSVASIDGALSEYLKPFQHEVEFTCGFCDAAGVTQMREILRWYVVTKLLNGGSMLLILTCTTKSGHGSRSLH